MAQIFIDAATKQHPHFSVGAVIIKENNTTLEKSLVLGKIDNNEAEWQTLIYALELCTHHHIKQALIYTDSQIVSDSIQKSYVKNTRFKSYLNKYFEMSQNFDLIIVSLITRENNKHADTLAKTCLYKELK